MSKQLRISTFGGLNIELDGEPVSGLASRKAEALLVYLACTQRIHSRESLATMLWDDRSQSRALGNLSVLFTSMRKSLAPFIEINRQSISMNLNSNYQLDAANLEALYNSWFEQKKTEKQPSSPKWEAIETSINSIHGDFLEGFFIRDSHEFNEWSLLERERYRRYLSEIYEDLVDFYLYSRKYKEGITPARRLLELDPLHERAHRQLMTLLARSGNRSGAINHYRTCQEVFAEELGVEPSRKTRELSMRIRVADHSPRSILPPQSTLFVGREMELALIGNRLADPECRLITISGPGGIGKTRLAIQAAGGWVDDYLNGVFFIPLTSVVSQDELLNTVADSLNVSFFPGEEPAQQLLDFLREKELLLVLDNFEHLITHASLIERIVKEAQFVKLLITSRIRLKLKEEWLVQLEGLEYPPKVEEAVDANMGFEQLTRFSSVQLFINNVRKIQPEFNLGKIENQGITRICQVVEGMPLGIEIASSWVQVLACEEIAVEIEKNLDFLETNLLDVPKRHRNMRAVFDHSWQLLTTDEKQAFKKLSVFKSGFTREAAWQVAGISISMLNSLTEKSLVRLTGRNRFDLHELLRQYAEMRLDEHPDEKLETLNRHSNFFANFLSQQESPIFSSDQQRVLSLITDSYENIRSAWKWSAEQRIVKNILNSCLTIWYFCEVRTRYHDAVEFGRQVQEGFFPDGIKESPIEDSGRLYVWSLLLQGYGYIWHAQYARAQEILAKGYKIAQVVGDRFLIAMMQNYLGLIAVFKREKGARKLLEDGLKNTYEVNIPWFSRFLLHNLGLDALNWGEFDRARFYFQEQMELSRVNASPRTISGYLKGLGDVEFAIGNYQEAKRNYQGALDGFKRIHDNRFSADILGRLGEIEYLGGNFDSAKAIYTESLAFAQELGVRHIISSTLNRLGFVTFELGEFEESYDHFQEALKIAISINVPYLALESLPGFASHQARYGDVIQAVELLSFTINNDDCSTETRNRCQKLLGELEKNMTQKISGAAIGRGKSRRFNDVVEEILWKVTALP